MKVFLCNCFYTMKTRQHSYQLGEDAYNCKSIELLKKLPNSSIVNDQPTDSLSNAVDVASFVGGENE